MDVHVTALMALAVALAAAISVHAPVGIALSDIEAFVARFDISANNEAAMYFIPAAAQEIVTLGHDDAQ